MRRKRNYGSQDDMSSTVFSDILTGTIGSGAVICIAFMIKQGVSPVTMSAPTNLTAIANDIAADLAKQADFIKDLEDDLNDSRNETYQSKQENREAAENFHNATEQFEGELEKLRRDLRDALEQVRQSGGALANIRNSRKVRVTLVLDTSTSMGPAIAQSRETFQFLTRTMPLALTSFQVGIVCHREGDVNQLNLLQIAHPDKDNGSSIKKVEQFLGSVEPVSRLSRIEEAIDLAIADFNRQSDEVGAEILLICADVGPGDVEGFTKEKGRDVIAKVRAWANSASTNRRVLAIDTASKEMRALPNMGLHQEFFKELGAINAGSRYSTQLPSMFQLVFESAFIQEE